MNLLMVAIHFRSRAYSKYRHVTMTSWANNSVLGICARLFCSPCHFVFMLNFPQINRQFSICIAHIGKVFKSAVRTLTKKRFDVS